MNPFVRPWCFTHTPRVALLPRADEMRPPLHKTEVHPCETRVLTPGLREVDESQTRTCVAPDAFVRGCAQGAQ